MSDALEEVIDSLRAENERLKRLVATAGRYLDGRIPNVPEADRQAMVAIAEEMKDVRDKNNG
jgi:hypothetical protein